MKVNALKVLKISAACCIAIFLANLLGLKSSTSAGIITLLSIQDTKKATFQIAGKRLLAFVPAVLFSLLIFWTVGFHVFSFGIFLFIFILFCYFAKLHEGITTNTVLISHVFAASSLHYTLVPVSYTHLSSPSEKNMHAYTSRISSGSFCSNSPTASFSTSL